MSEILLLNYVRISVILLESIKSKEVFYEYS